MGKRWESNYGTYNKFEFLVGSELHLMLLLRQKDFSTENGIVNEGLKKSNIHGIGISGF